MVIESSVTRIGGSEWTRELARFPSRSSFHALPWLETVASARGMEIVLLQAAADGRCVALWPLFETKRGPWRLLGSPFPGSSTPYLGPLFAPDADPASALEAFLRSAPLQPHAYLACRTLHQERPIDLAPFGFVPVRRLETYWIDLTEDEDSLWNRLRGSCRSRIRRARKLGLEVRPEETSEFIGDFWRMSVETFARNGARPTYDETFVRRLWETHHPAGRLVVLSAFFEGQRIATLVLPHDERTMAYWGGASWQAFRALPSGNLLQWEAVGEGRRRGLTGYDLLSTKGGPARFKASFGARTVEMGVEWEHTGSPWLAFVKRRYEWLARRRLGIAPRPAAASPGSLA